MSGEQVFVLALLAIIAVSCSLQAFLLKRNGTLTTEAINKAVLMAEDRARKRVTELPRRTPEPGVEVQTVFGVDVDPTADPLDQANTVTKVLERRAS
jgi:hypothetical protein